MAKVMLTIPDGQLKEIDKLIGYLSNTRAGVCGAIITNYLENQKARLENKYENEQKR